MPVPPIGAFRHKLTLQNAAASTTAGTRGEVTRTWADILTVRGALKQLGGQEAIIAKQIDARSTHEIWINYTGQLDGTKSRLKFGTRYFNITGAEDIEERGRYWRLTCAEAT